MEPEPSNDIPTTKMNFKDLAQPPENEDYEEEPAARFTLITQIRHYKVHQLVRRNGIRGTFIVESLKPVKPNSKAKKGGGNLKEADEDVDGHLYTIEAIDLNESTELEKNLFLNEIRLFASIDHPFVARYYEAFIDKITATIW